jgi:hypothetical protein
MSKAVFTAIDSLAWGRIMRWIRAKYRKGHHRIGMSELRRRFCDQGRRFDHNGVVFTGVSSVAVNRYHYHGNTIATPWTQQRQQPTADQRPRQVESPIPRDRYVGFGRAATRNGPVATPTPRSWPTPPARSSNGSPHIFNEFPARDTRNCVRSSVLGPLGRPGSGRYRRSHAEYA